MARQNGQVYEFGDFRLIPAENLLMNRGVAIQLKPKAFSTLVLLVEEHGHLVEKSTLMERIWEDSYVEEAAVSRCIWEIRNALGDDSKDQYFIQTVPKRGYRFVADVIEEKNTIETNALMGLVTDRTEASSAARTMPLTRSHPNSAALGLAKEPAKERVVSFPLSEDAKSRTGNTPVIVPRNELRNSRYLTWALLVATVLVISVGVYLLFGPTQPPNATGAQRLAVLPLKPVDAEQRHPALEFAIAESLILKISEARNLDVKRLYTVRKFTDLETDPTLAGRELAVDYVLVSNYQLADGRIRVTSHLMNVRTGEAEETFRSETSAGNVFAIQDTVANEIGNAVFAVFGKPTSTYTARRGTENEEAYSLYHEALYLVDKFTTDGSSRAIDLLERATQLDPNFAAAWAFKAQAYCQLGHQGGGVPSELFALAEPALEKALTLDPNNSVAYMVRGTIRRDYHWTFDEAYKDLNRAIELDPASTWAHRILAGLYHCDGRFREAVEEGKIAVDLHPTSLADKYFLGEYLIAAGQLEDGIAQMHRITQLEPSTPWAYRSLWRVSYLRGDKDAALEYFIKRKQLSPNSEESVAKIRSIYGSSGWNGVLQAELDAVRSKDTPGKHTTSKVYIAQLASLLGDNDLAFRYLDEALQHRAIGLSFLKVDPMLDGLREDPRYNDLLARTGL